MENVKRGTILIVEDRIQEKIGSFLDVLEKSGYNVQIATTLEEAKHKLKDNITILDGLILDFKFPISKNDLNEIINDRPAGVELLDEYKQIFVNQGIPIVINTTAGNDLKIQKLNEIGICIHEGEFGIIPQRYFRIMPLMPIFIVDHETNPLPRASRTMVEDILEMFNERTEKRKISASVQKPTNSKEWKKTKGRSFYNGMYLRDGD